MKTYKVYYEHPTLGRMDIEIDASSYLHAKLLFKNLMGYPIIIVVLISN